MTKTNIKCPVCRCGWDATFTRQDAPPLVHNVERDWKDELDTAILKCGYFCGCMIFFGIAMVAVK